MIVYQAFCYIYLVLRYQSTEPVDRCVNFCHSVQYSFNLEDIIISLWIPVWNIIIDETVKEDVIVK